MKLALALIFLSFSPLLFAHESMVGKGYFSCLACHQSSTGGGLLTQYGRGIARATSLRGGEYRPGTLGKALSLDGKLTHQVQARLAQLDQKRGDRFFPMQADYLAAVQVGDSQAVRVTVARAPERAKLLGRNETVEEVGGLSQFFVRQLLWEKRLEGEEDEGNWLIHFGRDHLAYSLNTDDHTAFIKAENRFTPTDFPTQLRFIFEGEKARHFFTGFGPSGQEVDSNREWGVGTKSEWLVLGDWAVAGVSTLYGKTPRLSRLLTGAHVKLGLGPLFLSGALDHTLRTLAGGGDSFGQFTALARAEVFLREWLSFSATKEWMSLDQPFERRREGHSFGARARVSESLALQADYKEWLEGTREHEFILGQLIFNLF